VGRHLVPATILAATLAFAVAALTAGLVPYRGWWWNPAVRLAVVGGITPMIYAVNIRIVPVFSRRNWRSETLLRAQIILTVAGAWLLFFGGTERNRDVVTTGVLLAWVGGVLFLVNTFALFRQEPLKNRPAPPLPYPEHRAIDKIATRFTSLSGLFVLLGLSIGVYVQLWPPRTGRWDLVWAHTMLVGFFLSMVSGVCYHVLARWTGHRWQSLRLIQIHFYVTLIALPLMLIALATNDQTLFSYAGPIQGLALWLFLWNIAPMVWRMTGPTRIALVLAIAALLAGVFLGAMFAGHPVVGVHYRIVHADLNLFGWTGLLISGVAYYLVPRFFGRPLRWPRLAAIQVGLLAAGITASALAWTWRIEKGGASDLITASQSVVAIGFVLLGVIVSGTLAFGKSKSGQATVSAVPMVKQFKRPQPPLQPTGN
jgi:hypothetical protein